jgi:hypothetical protein
MTGRVRLAAPAGAATPLATVRQAAPYIGRGGDDEGEAALVLLAAEVEAVTRAALLLRLL